MKIDTALGWLEFDARNHVPKSELPYQPPYGDQTIKSLTSAIHVRLFLAGATILRTTVRNKTTGYVQARIEGLPLFIKISYTEDEYSQSELTIIESHKRESGFSFLARDFQSFDDWLQSTVIEPFSGEHRYGMSLQQNIEVKPEETHFQPSATEAEIFDDKVFYTGTELLNLPPAPPMLWEPFIRAYDLWCLAGSSDVGKSMLLRQLAVAIVTGQSEFLGFKLNPRHRRVLIVSTEDDRSSVAQLLELQRLGLDISRLKVSFQSENTWKNLESEIQNEPIDLAILDSFGDLFRGNIKDSYQVRSFLDPYYQLATKYGCAIGFLHHTGKRTEYIAPSKNNLIGSQGLEAKMRIVMELRPDLADDTLRHLCVVKSNYLPKNLQQESIVLKFNSADFTFSATGERMPIDLLAKPKHRDNFQPRWDAYTQAIATGLKGTKLERATGLSLSQISKLKNEARRHGIDPGAADKKST